MTPTIKQHSEDFIKALIAEDTDAMEALPLKLEQEDRAAALKEILKRIKADAELLEKNTTLVEILEMADSYNDKVVELEALEEEKEEVVKEVKAELKKKEKEKEEA